MQISAEIRWFWPHSAPSTLREWFESETIHGCPVGGGDTDDPRPDLYLRDATQTELGIKARAAKTVEVKGLVAVSSNGIVEGPFRGPIEVWSKWPVPALRTEQVPTVETRKVRWMRKFDTSTATPREIVLDKKERPLDKNVKWPDRGCNVELTQVKIGAEVWWTFGFESFGLLQTVEDDLRAIALLLSTRSAPAPSDGFLASYPAWLSQRLASASLV